jgi:hypothetical protein
VSGIFIKNIIVGSSADKCGLLKVGDRILGMKKLLNLFYENMRENLENILQLSMELI